MSLSQGQSDGASNTVEVISGDFASATEKKKNYHAHFDCFSGAAGDMLLASCLDASGDPGHLREYVTSCLNRGIPELQGEFEIRTKTVWRGGMGSIAGMHVTVVSKYNDEPAPVPKRKDDHGHSHSHTHEHSQDHNHEHSHGHEHQHDHEIHSNSVEPELSDDHNHDHSHNHGHVHDLEHSHGHGHQHGHQHHSTSVEPELANNTHEHSHGHSHAHSHNNHSSNSSGPLRNLPEIKRLLEESDEAYIAPWVRKMAIRAFMELAMAEATTHGASGIEAVHFHEVGAVDSIVDTVGTLVALHHLGATTFSCSRIPIGEGTVWTDHGILPVPAPATLRLLMGMPTCPGPMGVITGELVTPTGAALLRALCLAGNDGCDKALTGRPPAFTIRKIGIGAGTKDFEKHPNILRLLIGDDVVTKN